VQRRLNLRDQSQVLSAILRYNNSMPYAQNVLGWAAAYATGVVPVDLPPLLGPAPPLGDAHLENAEGLGPNLPMNMHGLPSTDPLAQMPLIDLTGGPSNGPQPWSTQRPGPGPSCTVICISGDPGGPQQAFNAPPTPAGTPPAPFGVPPAPPPAAPPVPAPPAAPPAQVPPPAAPPVAPQPQPAVAPPAPAASPPAAPGGQPAAPQSAPPA